MIAILKCTIRLFLPKTSSKKKDSETEAETTTKRLTTKTSKVAKKARRTAEAQSRDDCITYLKNGKQEYVTVSGAQVAEAQEAVNLVESMSPEGMSSVAAN